MDEKHNPPEEEAIHLPIDGTLDLHTFHPRDLAFLIPDYLEECRKKDIHHVRIIHGKGTGTLRRSVHAILERHPGVLHYRLGDETSGSWGATLVTLQAPDPDCS
ncbi:MAG: DNA mismatch repair protein MutS [Desulfobulbus propionicus]|nr:MAG: DNA mismatch repair protein MutS [Desulfobulbus propionicus]